MRDLLELDRSEQEAFASSVLDGNPQHIIAALLLARLTVTPSEAAANENYDHNHDDRWEGC